MTPPPELLGGLRRLPLIGPVLADAGRRRILFTVLILICAVLTLFPERYRVASTLTPADPASLGLQGTLGQLGALNTVFGNQAAIEIALRLTESAIVRDRVATKLDLDRKLGTNNRTRTLRWLDREVNVRSLRGGIIQVDMKTDDVALGKAIVGAYAEATRAELATIALRQTEYKRAVLEKLVADSTERMMRAQEKFDRFRFERRTAEPKTEIGAVSGRIEGLRDAIKGNELQLKAALAFATPQNIRIQQLQAESNALRAELGRLLASQQRTGDSLSGVVKDSTRLTFLERDLVIGRTLFDSYNRYLLGTYVEDLTATANIRILEPPFSDPERQYNYIPFSIGILLVLLGLAFEMQAFRRSVGTA